jgi:hypothetical protein
MGAVTDNLAFGAQDGILQRNRIEKPRTVHLRARHHRYSRHIQFFDPILTTYYLATSNFVDAWVSIRSLHSFSLSLWSDLFSGRNRSGESTAPSQKIMCTPRQSLL